MEIYISSADMMTRNTRRRVEVACPIYDPVLKRRIKAMIGILKKDNVQATCLKSNGEYALKKSKGDEKVNSQIYLLNEARRSQRQPISRKRNFFDYVRSFFPGEGKNKK